MAITLYSNGIVEEYKPSNLVFTEEELVTLFTEFSSIKTMRLISVLNTWCIFGIGNNDSTEFNKIVTDIIKENVFSHALFIHDSEINQNWNSTDNIIYKNYNEFKLNINKLIEETAFQIMKEWSENSEHKNKSNILPQLTPLGSTEDKRILFGYNYYDQSKEFYKHEEFYRFSQKVYDYLITNKQIKEPFTIYADKKAMIIIKKDEVNPFLETLLEKFQSKEEYEICVNITKIMKDWSKTNKFTKTKRNRNSLLKSIKDSTK